MECAAPSSLLVTLPLRHFRFTGFRERRDRPFLPSHGFASKPGRNQKLRLVVVVGLQMWESLQRFPSLALCARHHVQAIRLPLPVPPGAADTLLLSTKPPRPCAPSCWPERLPRVEVACAPPVVPPRL